MPNVATFVDMWHNARPYSILQDLFQRFTDLGEAMRMTCCCVCTVILHDMATLYATVNYAPGPVRASHLCEAHPGFHDADV